MVTVISHFYNEEFLLPFWLKYHKRFFSHGIMINYDSTDRSVDIIREICPNWQIVKTRNNWFNAEDCDQEVMEYENTISGWKMVLNTTEFLVVANLEKTINQTNNIIKTTGVIMVDSPEEYDKAINEDFLPLQRQYGYLERNFTSGILTRSRILHKLVNGNYDPGRHDTFHKTKIDFRDDIFVLWFGWCPFKYIKDRKLQIKYKIPKEDLELKRGIEHFMTSQEMDQKFLENQKRAMNLYDIPFYKDALFTSLKRSIKFL